MKFHSSVYGSNVTINNDVASKISERCFSDGIVFSEENIAVNKPIIVQVEYFDSYFWKGGLIIGLTTRDPSTFESNKFNLKYSYPFGLCTEDNVWISSASLTNTNSRLTLMLTSKNELIALVNNESHFLLLNDLPAEPLWLIFDLFGNVNSISFVDYRLSKLQIPQNVLLLGPNRVKEYKKACVRGALSYNTGRLFIVGPYGAGKSSVKKALLGLSTDKDNEAVPLDCKSFCFSHQGGQWNSKGTPAGERRSSLKEQMKDAIAFNIARQLSIKKEDDAEGSTASCNASMVKSALRLNKKQLSTDINETDLNEMVSGLSDSIKELVQKYLTEKTGETEEDSGLENPSFEMQEAIKYNIWDFSGDQLYFLVNQVLLTSYAVYLLVIDISEDLDTPFSQSKDCSIQVETRKSDFSTLKLIHFWLSAIYSHVGSHVFSSTFDSENPEKNEDSFHSSPRVILLGTHRNSVHLEPITRDQIIKETFDRIQQSLEGKPYHKLIHSKYFAVDCAQMSLDEPLLLTELRSAIDDAFLEQRLVKFDVPYAWIELNKIFEKLVRRGIYFADFHQIHEVTRSHISELDSGESLQVALDFYHSQGTIYCFVSSYLGVTETLIILNPLWFLSCFHQLCDFLRNAAQEEGDSFQSGVLKEDTFNKAWKDHASHKVVLIGCLERLDILCELCPYFGIEEPPDVAASAMQPKIYIFPWMSQVLPENSGGGGGPEYDLNNSHCFQIAIDFSDLLPIGLFSRFLVRLCRWSWNQGWGRHPEICNSLARIAVDFDHDVVIKLQLEKGVIKLLIVRLYDNENDVAIGGPNPNICIKVRHLVETELEIIQNTFYRRVRYSLKVPCPCELQCKEHENSACTDDNCVHYLLLNECLSKKIVECDYRQIRTTFVQKYFPQAAFYASGEPIYVAEHQALNENSNTLYDIVAGWENIFHAEPMWMRDAAKMLLPSPGKDWIALAKKLGYSDRDITKLGEEVTPSLALLRDWYESNGRTRYCIDVLMSCLRMVSREDVITVIETDVEPEGSAPPIFISYQWDSQETVLDLRRRLELSGFPCWMDVGLIGAGDSLYGKIYEGISRAKVILCCLTPRYAASRLCTREVTLADVLHKPILPIMLEPTPWPPPGPMAVVMSSLVYVDLCGIGGHGGIGKRADSETRFRDILDRIARYVAGYVDMPILARNMPIPDLFSPSQNLSPRLSALSPSTADLQVESGLDRHQPVPEVNDAVIGGAAAAAAAAAAAENDSQEENLTLNGDDNFSEDSISVLSHIQNNNRISNCSVCVLF